METKHPNLSEMAALWDACGGFLYESRGGRLLCRESLPRRSKPRRIYFSKNWGRDALVSDLAKRGKAEWADVVQSVEAAILADKGARVAPQAWR